MHVCVAAKSYNSGSAGEACESVGCVAKAERCLWASMCSDVHVAHLVQHTQEQEPIRARSHFKDLRKATINPETTQGTTAQNATI